MRVERGTVAALLPILLTLAACSQGTTGGVSATDGGPPTVVSGASADPRTSAPTGSSAVSQTDTPWGRIWDGVPAGFPRFPGSAPAADASASPSSARFTVPGGEPEEIAGWLQAALETATFSTDVSGPLEDGSMALDSVGNGECRVQTTINPLGDMTFITVLYGSGCPMA